MTTTTTLGREAMPPARRALLTIAVAATLIGGTVAAAGIVRGDTTSSSTSAPGAVAPVPTDIAVAEAATKARPDDPSAWRTLAALTLQQLVRTSDPAYVTPTRDALARADALAPRDAGTATIRGALALTLHDFAGARRDGLDAIATSPTNRDALGVLVDASVELGRYDDAASYVGRLLAVRPGTPAYARASYLRELHGDTAGARQAMQQAEASASDPDDQATIATFVGDLALADRDLGAAQAAYQRARNAVPGQLNATLGLARVTLARGDLAGATAFAQDAADRSPQAAATVLLGEIEQAAGRPDDAAKAFALARANVALLVAGGYTVDLESAVFEADHGDPQRAVELARTAHAARRTVYTADALGWALLRAGRPADALPYVEESLAIGTPTASLRAHAALAFAAAGRAVDAATQLQAAFARAPWTSLALRAPATELGHRLGLTVPPDWSTP